MKFLCVPCDSPMKLQTVGPPERGSLSVVYSCPECGYEMAMLTNAYETQVVQSLGVRIGPAFAPKALRRVKPKLQRRRAAGGKCPFSAMIPGTEGTSRAGRAEPKPGAVDCRRRSAAREHPRVRSPYGANRHREIRARKGALEVDEKILDAAREFFGM